MLGKRAVELVEKAFEFVICLAGAGITIILFLNVFLRYVFRSPFSWAEEVTILLMVWSAFLAGAILQKRDEHIYLDYLFQSFSDRAKWLIRNLGRLCVCFVLILHFFSSINLMELQARTFTPSLRLPMTVFALAVLLGIGGMLLFSIIQTVNGLKKGDF